MMTQLKSYLLQSTELKALVDPALHTEEEQGRSWAGVGHCHPRASSAKTRGFHTQLDEGPETP